MKKRYEEVNKIYEIFFEDENVEKIEQVSDVKVGDIVELVQDIGANSKIVYHKGDKGEIKKVLSDGRFIIKMDLDNISKDMNIKNSEGSAYFRERFKVIMRNGKVVFDTVTK